MPSDMGPEWVESLMADNTLTLDRLREALGSEYHFEREIGHGGMATVFLANDVELNRPVAIKVLKSEVAAAIGPSRFLREIQIASRLSHPHLVPLHASGEKNGLLYYVMPFVEGETLRDRLKRDKQLSIDEALRITRDVAAGLSYAHQHGVVHRDIKPENILLQDGHAIVVDFGIARAITVSANEPLTTSGMIIGTPMYMSPEQGLGTRELDARTDIYSLACVLYEMLAGEPPFGGPSLQAIVARHASERVPSLRLVRPGVSEEFEAALGRALAKAPADRFATMDDFTRALDGARPDTGRRGLLGKRRLRAVAVATGVTLATVIAAVALRASLDGSLSEHDWVLVADFDAPPGDQQSGDVVRELATRALQQSSFVRLVDRRQLNEVMRHAGIPETTFVDAAKARELAVRSSVRAILRGGVRRLDSSTYEIVLHVVDVEDGLSLASTVGTAREATLPDTIHELVRRLRQELGERRADISATRPLRDVATPSLQAFRHYSQALDRVNIAGDLSGSNALLAEALALDPEFASAWALLGTNHVTARQLDSARIAYGRALALPGRLSDAELYRLKGDAAYALDRDLPSAVKWYDLYLAEAPHSRSGHSNRALYRSALGQYEAALSDLDRAVQLNPFGPELIQPVILNRAAILVTVGRNEDAQRATAMLTGPFATYMKIMVASATSRWSVAESLSAAAGDDPVTTGVFRINATASRASALAAQGSVVAADSLLRAAAAASRGSTARWYERARLLLALASGSRLEARTDLVASDTTPAGDMLRLLWAAAAGDTASARAGLVRLARSSSRTSASLGDGPLLIEAMIAAREDNWPGVISLVGSRAAAGEHDPIMLDRPDSFMMRWLVATAFERVGAADSASAYYSLILRPIHLPPGHYALRGLPFGFAHFRLAALAEKLGDRPAALRHLDAFVAAFDAPDVVTGPLVQAAIDRREVLSAAADTRPRTRSSAAANPARALAVSP